MSTDEPVRKTSEGKETPGLKSSIAKALFDSLSPSRSPSLRAGNIVDVLTATTAIVSPDKKKVFDLSLSEGDLTLTDEYKTPTTVLRTTSSQDHLPSACSTSQKSVVAEAALKVGVICFVSDKQSKPSVGMVGRVPQWWPDGGNGPLRCELWSTRARRVLELIY
ncbi:unnamed protein product [Nippostrongylus brasiliensis]|uniref:Uncharacterized protein n=1 Tax=Nippostrongylus brasiliensis TaxID=27835 RepID=A0A0N4XWL6_NIPBR|nr:unnamed protein product [Nippostrongylus brasiliensis]